jgi:hypothetical protein
MEPWVSGRRRKVWKRKPCCGAGWLGGSSGKQRPISRTNSRGRTTGAGVGRWLTVLGATEPWVRYSAWCGERRGCHDVVTVAWQYLAGRYLDACTEEGGHGSTRHEALRPIWSSRLGGRDAAVLTLTCWEQGEPYRDAAGRSRFVCLPALWEFAGTTAAAGELHSIGHKRRDDQALPRGGCAGWQSRKVYRSRSRAC